MKPLVIIPTYQERGNLEAVIGGVLGSGNFQVLVVDDASPDGTGVLAEKLGRRSRGRVHVLHRPGKLGLGSAYRDGFRWALDRGFDAIIEMDADLSHDPRYLPELLAALEDCDVVIGSRYLEGISVVNWPLYRLAMSTFANLYARTLTGLPVRDCTSGFVCFSRKALSAIPFGSTRSDGYAFQIETKFLAWRNGFRLREIPIIFVDRSHGTSKMSGHIMIEAVLAVLRLSGSRLGNDPAR